MDREKVVWSNIVGKDTKLDGNMELLVSGGSIINNCFKSFVFGDKKIDGDYNQVPIVTNEGIVGSVCVLNDNGFCFQMCQLIAKILMIELNIS